MVSRKTTNRTDTIDITHDVNAAYDEVFHLLLEQEDYLTSGDNSRPLQSLPAIERLFVINQEMRITARLGAALAWLLMVRAVTDGDADASDVTALDHVDPFDLATCCLDTKAHRDHRLPDRLRDLLSQSHDIYLKIIEMDGQVRGATQTAH